MSEYAALGSLIISIIALIISVITNTKKYELTIVQRTELLDWFYKVTELLTTLRLYIEEDSIDNTDKLAQLSALIEYGRFFFPNIDKGDEYGKEKPSAYRGYRDITLEFLIYSYDILRKNNAKKYIAHLEKLQRLFTSRFFDILAPKKHNKLISKYTKISFKNEMSLQDFLASDPNKTDYFYNI